MVRVYNMIYDRVCTCIFYRRTLHISDFHTEFEIMKMSCSAPSEAAAADEAETKSETTNGSSKKALCLTDSLRDYLQQISETGQTRYYCVCACVCARV